MGRNAEQFVSVLQGAGVAALVDIRYTPVSMYKPDFSKRNLQQLLEENGIAYLHWPDLGVPREIRGRAVGQVDRTLIWDWYDAHVAESFAGNQIGHFFNAVDHPAAFMCVELDPTSCHRHRLSLALERWGFRSFDL